MKAMETLQDLIEEAKVRAVWWGLCIFGISYFLSHTSKSMWTNIPISILILCALRYLCYEVDFRWRVRRVHKQTYLSHLQKKQLSLTDPRLGTLPSMPKWTRKIDSPPVEAAIRDFINKVLQDFVVDLWYSSITPDKEAPELIRGIILDCIGEISGRIKEINLVDLLTRDMVELIGNHLDLFRKNQSIIGAKVMETLSSEERDERLKYHMMVSKELHPALTSPECEYKVLQQLIGGLLAIVLDSREAQCPLVRCFSRELLTCLVMEPVMNLASPGYINELIEVIFLAANDNKDKEASTPGMVNAEAFHQHNSSIGNSQSSDHGARRNITSSQSGDMILAGTAGEISTSKITMFQEDSAYSLHPRPADWARVLDAATQRRTEVLTPENLENMWTKGRNYKKKTAKLAKAAVPGTVKMNSEILDNYVHAGCGKESSTSIHNTEISSEKKYPVQSSVIVVNAKYESQAMGQMPPIDGVPAEGWDGGVRKLTTNNKHQLKRSSSTSDLKKQRSVDSAFTGRIGDTISPAVLYDSGAGDVSKPLTLNEGSLHTPKLKCRVVGAYFEKLGSNSFAVYSIAVTDVENKTWFVKRRYRNFERLHRHLKDIPNYTLHLPPKRFLSSSIDDYFVHQRCILLDKYLQDLLSLANIAEQHEVWDFLSAASKNYSFGKSTSVMKTLAVNVDDAMDDIVRQFKGVSDGLRRKVVGSPPSLSNSPSLTMSEKVTSSYLNEEDSNKSSLNYKSMDLSRSLSDDEGHDEEGSGASVSGWHSDNELNLKGFPPRVIKKTDGSRSLDSQKSEPLQKFDRVFPDQDYASNIMMTSDVSVDSIGVPPEWSPPNVSVPILNLVDKVFQLNRRGWLRRQVFWISKQILQLMMEDAIDDWLVRRIHWLRRDDVIAQGIRWVQDVLWPNGTFFIKLESNRERDDGSESSQKTTTSTTRVPKGSRPLSFEQQLEASRRAKDVEKILLGGAPTTLVSLIGYKQYQRCAKDMYYFLQSTVCIKQLAYGMLELLLVSLFPELRDLILDIHKKHRQPA